MTKRILSVFYCIILCAAVSAQFDIIAVGQLPEAVANNAVCEGFIGDKPYLFSFGGIDNSKIYSGIHNRSYRFDIQNGTAEEIDPLPDMRGKIAAAANRLGNVIYISGGYHVFQNGSELSSNKMHRYDVVNNSYLEDGMDIPIATDDHVQAVWRDSLIYLITGWSNNGNIPQVQIYNPSQDNWMMGTATPNDNNYKSFGASGTIVGDTIYYFGGASSASGFNIQNQLRKGIINPNNPSQIEWSISTPDPSINGYRMAATYHDGLLYWIGGSNTTYNFNGIAYNGTGGVPPSNRILFTDINNFEWNEYFADEIPMDLRGIASVRNTTLFLAGGMLSNQTVSDKVYQLELITATNEKVNKATESPFKLFPNPFQDYVTISNSLGNTAEAKLYDSQGCLILEKEMRKNENRISLEEIPNGLYFLVLQTKSAIFVEKLKKE